MIADLAPVVAALSAAAVVLVVRPGSRPRTARRLRGLRPAPGGQAGGDQAGDARAALTVPMLLDLVAEVVASGSSPSRAVAAVGECLGRVHDPAGAELLRLSGRLTGPASAPSPAVPGTAAAAEVLGAALALSVATGAGPVALIRAAAEEHRRRAHAAQVRAAHRLGVMVLLPTGLCLLPAFVLLTVVPLVIDLVLG